MKIVLYTACILSFTLLMNAQSLIIHKNDGSIQSFTLSQIDRILFSGVPCHEVATVDYSGKTYHTVQIGTQCWLKENLNVGTMIDSMQEQANNGIIEKYCYRNSLANCDTYGGLYQWDEAMQYETTQGANGICPAGWHIPKFSEFQVLSTEVEGNSNALKAKGQGIGAGAGINISGFSALLAGRRSQALGFSYLSSYTDFWSSTDQNETYAYFMGLRYDDGVVYLEYTGIRTYGYSVRCIKD
jgi:uncharacterized protein (TIGR02145 family)